MDDANNFTDLRELAIAIEYGVMAILLAGSFLAGLYVCDLAVLTHAQGWLLAGHRTT